MTDERVDWETIAPEEVVVRLRALTDRETFDPEPFRAALKRPEVAEVALQLLGDLSIQEAWDLLEEVAETNRALRKAARRAQHRMRTRGFRPQVAQRAPVPSKVVRVLATGFNEQGEQILRVLQEAPLGMLRSVRFLVGPDGIDDIAVVTGNRKDIEEALAEMERSLAAAVPGFLVEVNLPYVARRVRSAAARMREAGKRLPLDYEETTELFAGVPEDPWPAELDADGSRPSPAEAAQLLQEALFASWHLPETRLEPFAKEWMKISGAIPHFVEERLPNLALLQARGGMTARVIEEVLDTATCARYREQLQEQARLFLFLGKAELARLAARCAREFDRVPPLENAFLRTLVERSMESALAALAYRERQEEEKHEAFVQLQKAGGLWVPRPQPPEEGEAPAGPSLWLPGMDL